MQNRTNLSFYSPRPTPSARSKQSSFHVTRRLAEFARSKISILLFLALASSAFVGLGCTSSTSATVFMVVDNVAWLPSESALIALVEKQTVSALDNSISYTVGLYNFGADGSLGSVMGPGDVVEAYWNSAVLSLSNDGSTAYVQLGASIYRVNIHDNTTTKLVQTAALLGVSPDSKYIISTDASPTDRAPVYTIYDVSANPVRRVRQFTPPNIINNRCLWIDGGTFVVTSSDSAGSNISVWDTNGTILHTYPNAEAPLAASAYASSSHDLFVRNNSRGIDRINILTNVRTAVVSQDSVESFDASRDGTLLAYSSGKVAQPYALFAVNTQNGHSASIGSDAFQPMISPNGDRVAFIHNASPNRDVKVLGISIPN